MIQITPIFDVFIIDFGSVHNGSTKSDDYSTLKNDLESLNVPIIDLLSEYLPHLVPISNRIPSISRLPQLPSLLPVLPSQEEDLISKSIQETLQSIQQEEKMKRK